MSASRLLSAKLLEPTTTVSPLALPPESGSSDLLSEDEPHPVTSAAVAASAMAAAPGYLVLDQLFFAFEVTIPVPGSDVGTGVQAWLWSPRAGREHRTPLIQSSRFLVSQEKSGHRLASMSAQL